jgi:hypothetical protein
MTMCDFPHRELCSKRVCNCRNPVGTTNSNLSCHATTCQSLPFSQKIRDQLQSQPKRHDALMQNMHVYTTRYVAKQTCDATTKSGCQACWLHEIVKTLPSSNQTYWTKSSFLLAFSYVALQEFSWNPVMFGRLQRL